MTQLISNVLMQPNPNAVERSQTLIEKLNDHKETIVVLRGTEKQGSNEFNFLGHHLLGFQTAIDIVKQHSQEVCNWRNNKGTGLWECHYGGDYTSDCGLEWNMSNKDSPNENEMHFCPKCGKKLVEVQPPSEVQDDC